MNTNHDRIRFILKNPTHEYVMLDKSNFSNTRNVSLNQHCPIYGYNTEFKIPGNDGFPISKEKGF